MPQDALPGPQRLHLITDVSPLAVDLIEPESAADALVRHSVERGQKTQLPIALVGERQTRPKIAGQPQSVAFTVPAAQTSLQIDYVQFGGNAYLQYDLVPTSAISPTQPPVTGGPFATARVTAGKLNVRSAPSSSAPVVTQVRFGEEFPVYGKSADGRWYLIDVHGTQGWASGVYLRVDRPANVPVVDAGAQVPPAPPAADGQPIATATPFAVNVRTGPSTSASKLATMPIGATAPIIGRTADSTWWQVNFNGIVGWVSAQYAVIQQNANINNIPVTG